MYMPAETNRLRYTLYQQTVRAYKFCNCIFEVSTTSGEQSTVSLPDS